MVACSSRSHINYLKNESAKSKNRTERFDLRNKLKKVEEIEVDKWENGKKIRKKIKVDHILYKVLKF